MAKEVVKEFIFANSMLGTTIQDSGMKERSNAILRTLSSSLVFTLI